jgi:hypothetical protein
MTLEPIGALALLVGLACIVYGQKLSIYALLMASLLGASAAAFVTALNNSNVQPAHFLLMFLAMDLLLRGHVLKMGLASLAAPRAGFWLLLTLIYGALTTIFMPRLFAGATYVFNIAQNSTDGAGIVQVPLGPVSANVTQVLYLAGDFVCFLIFYAYSGARDGLETVARAMIVCAFVNIGFALLDVVSHVTQTPELLSFLRNTNYRMLDDVELAGFKRIVGSFTEASSFAFATLGLFTFAFTLWIRGIYQRAAGAAAVLSLVAILFATSTTGYVGLCSFLLIQYAMFLAQLLARRATRNILAFLVFAPLVVSLIVVSVWMDADARHTVAQLIDITIFSKLDSDSGIERASWNAQALRAFRDTMGLGAGIGSVRASSWLIAVPASIGVLGALAYGMFVACVLVGRPFRRPDPRAGAIQSAARASCLAQILASSVAGSFIDLGLVFFALAGAACAPRDANVEPAGARPAGPSALGRMPHGAARAGT